MSSNYSINCYSDQIPASHDNPCPPDVPLCLNANSPSSSGHRAYRRRGCVSRHEAEHADTRGSVRFFAATQPVLQSAVNWPLQRSLPAWLLFCSSVEPCLISAPPFRARLVPTFPSWWFQNRTRAPRDCDQGRQCPDCDWSDVFAWSTLPLSKFGPQIQHIFGHHLSSTSALYRFANGEELSS